MEEKREWYEVHWTRVDGQGRVVIPAEIRAQLDMEPGKSVGFLLEDDRLSLITVRQGVERTQKLVRQHIGPTSGRSLVDELIAERRAEAERE